MSKIYDKAFKVGFCINILIFVIVNFISFIVSRSEYANRQIKFADSRYSWGFPFNWDEIFLDSMFIRGGMLNFIVMIFCGFILGILLKPILSEILASRAESN
jgi:hypothetical protein